MDNNHFLTNTYLQWSSKSWNNIEKSLDLVKMNDYTVYKSQLKPSLCISDKWIIVIE